VVKNIILQPISSRSWVTFLDLWKLALSIIRTMPGFKDGTKTRSTYVSKIDLFEYPSKMNGANNIFKLSAAVILYRVVRSALFCAKQRSPRGAHPVITTSLSSIPVSSE